MSIYSRSSFSTSRKSVMSLRAADLPEAGKAGLDAQAAAVVEIVLLELVYRGGLVPTRLMLPIRILKN